MNYRDRLFLSYGKRVDAIEQTDEEKEKWFERHVDRHYIPWIRPFSINEPILEVGCARGFLLRALQQRGFYNLTGLDVCDEELMRARRRLTEAKLFSLKLAQYPGRQNQRVVIAKAVLEHQEKFQVIPFLEHIADILRPEGWAVIEVPNMDWIGASHERYMDFTHEAGFTAESLLQVMSEVFRDVRVVPIVERPRFLHRPLLRLLRYLDSGVPASLWARSLLGVGIK